MLFTPFDLTVVEVEWQGKPMGHAAPHHIGRHVHPAVKPAATGPVEPTGIDYLQLLEATHHAEVGQAINFDALARTPTIPATITPPGTALSHQRHPDSAVTTYRS